MHCSTGAPLEGSQGGRAFYQGTAGSSGSTNSLPIAFNTTYKVVGLDTGSGANVVAIATTNLTTITLWGKRPSDGSYANTGADYLAIGV